MRRIAAKYATVALSLAGSAILLFSCGEAEQADEAPQEALMTEYSEHLSIVNSQNGRRSYHFETPLLEGYSEAREPYREFRKGIRMTTYQDDSLTTVDAVLTANYAIYYTDRELWEARGDVVVEKSDGRTLYTQQLFWNARTRKVYSNVDSKIVQNGGRDVLVGEGFEADDDFKDWRFRRHRTRLEVDMAPRDPADSAARARREARAGASAADDTLPAADRPKAGQSAAPRPAAIPEPDAKRPRPAGRMRRNGERMPAAPVPERNEEPARLLREADADAAPAVRTQTRGAGAGKLRLQQAESAGSSRSAETPAVSDNPELTQR